MDETIDLERFAALSAELDAGAQREELCAREGISVAAWTAAQEAWLGRLAAETARQRYVLTNRYNTAFVDRRRALSRGIQVRRAPAASAPKRPAVAPPAIVEGVAPPAVVEGVAPSFDRPSFERPGYEPPRVAPPPTVTAPPLAAEPVWMEAEPELETWEQQPPRPGTMALPAMAEPVLPFVQGPAPAEVAKPAPAPTPSGPSMGGSTVLGAISPFAVGAALPFQQGAPPAPPPPAVLKPAEAPKAAEPPMDGSTVFGAISPFAAGANPLPFARGAQPAAPAPAKHVGTNLGLPFQQPAAPPQAAPLQAAPPQAAPPQVAPPQAAAKLTLEQFASLTAEIAVNPRATAQIRARYGLDEAAHRAEAEAQHRRFQGDKAAYDRYLELFQSYRDYVARAQR